MKNHCAGLWDYGNKQWQGLTKDFYAPRYSLYAARAIDAIRAHSTFNTSGFVADVSSVAATWTTSHAPQSRYPAVAQGDALTVSTALFDKYAAVFLSTELHS
jgi:alpha-N-acetylglucosaminidase